MEPRGEDLGNSNIAFKASGLLYCFSCITYCTWKSQYMLLSVDGCLTEKKAGLLEAVALYIAQDHSPVIEGPSSLFLDLVSGIKNYSNWPTIPQVYLNGEFVGGCDILLQMHQNGDLVEELKKLGIRSALLDAEKDQDKK
nr:PREDICTED: glutaredoxin-related protein 5, mitochondrial isoform X1 [Apteryx mantelli mantelli]